MRTRSTPLPFLPLEVKGHILRFCEVGTLAVSSRVCLAFLEMAGPILYKDITITGKEQLEKLVRSEVSISDPVARHVGKVDGADVGLVDVLVRMSSPRSRLSSRSTRQSRSPTSL